VSATAVAASCAVERLRLYHFRNYDDLTVRFANGVNVISGANAQGKTNLLEAVATLALTRSPRAGSSDALLRWGSDVALIEGDVLRPGGTRTVAARFSRDSDTGRVHRVMTVDGNRSAAGVVLGLCQVVLFWPDDLLLVKAGPEGRRRLLDSVLAQSDPTAADSIVRYRRVLEQRNALLKQLRAGTGNRSALASFTRELAALGARVEVARAGLISGLAPLAASALTQLTGGRESLEIRYAPRRGAAVGEAALAESLLLRALEAHAAEELARGITVIGPHRDDLELLLDGKPARTMASQGQQRSIVLALKMAEVDYFAQRTATSPVVILDDVLSELDPARRRDLVRLLAAREPLQVLLTTAEPLADLGQLSVTRRFIVEGGRVEAA
jgi:DNA replication and repair protein RecF